MFGEKKYNAYLDELCEEAARALRTSQSYTLVVSQSRVRGRLDEKLARIVRDLQEIGFAVTHVDHGADPYNAYVTVEAGSLRAQQPADSTTDSQTPVVESGYWPTEAAPPGAPASALPELRQLVESHRYADAFELRGGLGIVLSDPDGTDRETAFWVNALGALAGFRCGLTMNDDPMGGYLGNADAYVDRDAPDQDALMTELDRMAFG